MWGRLGVFYCEGGSCKRISWKVSQSGIRIIQHKGAKETVVCAFNDGLYLLNIRKWPKFWRHGKTNTNPRRRWSIGFWNRLAIAPTSFPSFNTWPRRVFIDLFRPNWFNRIPKSIKVDWRSESKMPVCYTFMFVVKVVSIVGRNIVFIILSLSSRFAPRYFFMKFPSI